MRRRRRSPGLATGPIITFRREAADGWPRLADNENGWAWTAVAVSVCPLPIIAICVRISFAIADNNKALAVRCTFATSILSQSSL